MKQLNTAGLSTDNIISDVLEVGEASLRSKHYNDTYDFITIFENLLLNYRNNLAVVTYLELTQFGAQLKSDS